MSTSKKRISCPVSLIIIVTSYLLLSGCSGDSNSAKDKINVVATTGIVADLVKNIGGDKVQVTALMGPGVDPHLYKASERDVSRMADADIIFFNGLHLEGAMAEVLEKLGNRKKTVGVGNNIPASFLLSPPQFANAHDPHIWFDVRLWMKAAKVVHEHLVRFDEKNQEYYDSAMSAYLEELQSLHQYVLSRVEQIPENRRVLITAHDAFNYFGRAYGFEVRGLQGISTAAEAGTGDVQELAEFIASRKIPAIFVESSVPVRNIEAVQAAVKSRGFDVIIGGELFSDAMGSEGTPEANYVGMVRHNINAITAALIVE